ncbi:MAG: NAD(P)-dependent oxidoreductase [Acidobacteriota bacterium]
MQHVGWVGLGVMGSEITQRLIAKGHSVVGHNRTRAKAAALEAMGMGWGPSPRSVAETSDIVCSMVTDTKALHAVTDGPDGILAGLGPGKLYVDMSTVSPAASRELTGRVSATGAVMLNAPVSGSVVTIRQGQLAVMVSGARAAYERARPFLLDIGPKVTHVGEDPGLALAMKIAVNLNLQVQMQAFCEAVLLAEKAGVPRELAVEILSLDTAADVFVNTVVTSPMVKYRGPFVLKMPEVAWFNVNMMQKDMNLALEMGQRLDVPLPATAISNEFLTAARAMGLAHHDMAIVFDVLAALAGVEVER